MLLRKVGGPQSASAGRAVLPAQADTRRALAERSANVQTPSRAGQQSDGARKKPLQYFAGVVVPLPSPPAATATTTTAAATAQQHRWESEPELMARLRSVEQMLEFRPRSSREGTGQEHAPLQLQSASELVGVAIEAGWLSREDLLAA
ncbi:hypothetical protein KEM52_003394 [Ascosphaera acerosa]|nr:hypothetical protein KEM52_003394 [Ascosphaera acerosa]